MKCLYQLVVFLTILSSYLSFAQSSQSDVIIGENHIITSEILEGKREFQIHLPEGYHSSQKSYPVLYILDGQLHFINGVAIQRSLQVPGVIPEMIVVGIENSYPQRRDLRWSNREVYYKFIQKELIPFIDSSFRTSDTRVLFGWEMGAFFASYALLNSNPLFDGVVLANGGSPNNEMIATFKNTQLKEKSYLYMVNSNKDIYTIQYTDDLAKLLKTEIPSNLKWTYEKFDKETHETLPYLALFHGLKYYYHNFSTLDFSSFEEYENLGGLSYLKAYFKERGERFGFSGEIDNATKNGLIWLAWNKDDFDYFKLFMNEFKDVLSTERYDSAYWQNRLAQMYLKHNDINAAIPFFKNGINKYGDSNELAEMYFGLSKIYNQKNDRNGAISNIKKAIKIAQKNSDSSLETYKGFLSQLRKTN